MSATSRNVLRGIRQDPAAVALAKEVETLEAKLDEAERKLAGVRTLVALGGHTAAYDLRADLRDLVGED